MGDLFRLTAQEKPDKRTLLLVTMEPDMPLVLNDTLEYSYLSYPAAGEGLPIVDG